MKKTAVIAVANNKGGVAKTTTACNLGRGLAMKVSKTNEAVLIVDLDPQGNVSDFFNLREYVYDEERNPDGRCISFALLEEASLKEMIVPVKRQGKTNLYVLPASRALEAATMILLRDENNRQMDMQQRGTSRIPPLDELLAHVLAPVMGVFRYIILDCPPKLDALKRAVYHFADHVIVPAKSEFISVAGTAEHTEDLSRLIEENPDFYKARILYILPTMVHEREVADGQMRESLARMYGQDLIAHPIPQSVKVKESPGAGGLSIFEYDPRSAPGLAYAKLVEGVAARV